MDIRIVRSLPEKEWWDFVDGHPHGNIFHTPDMYRVFERAKGHRPGLWAAKSGDGQVLALLTPVQISLVGSVAHYFTTRAVAYGSLLWESSQMGEEALAVLLRAYAQGTERKVVFTELRNLSDKSDVQKALTACGFVYEEHLNYLIDLEGPLETVLQSIGRRTRKNIRRGLNRGEVQVGEVRNREQVGDCYRLICESYRAAGVPLADSSLFEAAFDVLLPKNMVRFTLAQVDRVPVAVSVELLYKKVAYGWYSGLDRAFSAYVPNELLMWHILGWSHENGYKLYDFSGAGKPDEEYGVRDFKSKFGGQLVCYGRNTFMHAPTRFKISVAGYQIYLAMLKLRDRAMKKKGSLVDG